MHNIKAAPHRTLTSLPNLFCPLALSLLGWIAYLQAGLPFHHPLDTPLSQLGHTAWLDRQNFIVPLGLSIVLGVFSMGCVSDQRAGTNSIPLFVGLTLASLALLSGLGYSLSGHFEFQSATLFAGGMALGGLAAWPVAAVAHRFLQARTNSLRSLWTVLAWALPLLVLLPLDPMAVLASPSASALDIPAQFYQVIKAILPWTVLAVVAGLLGQAGPTRVWGLAGTVVSLICAVLVADIVHIGDIVQILAVIPGLAAGLWLGERSRSAQTFIAQTRHDALSHAPVSVVATVPEENTARDTEQQPRALRPRQSPHADASLETDTNPTYLAWSGRLLGLLLLLAAVVGLAFFPRWEFALGLGFSLYLVALWRHPTIWLVVMLAAIPLLDLAPWTGRFFFDEFDLLMLATFGMLWLLGAPASVARPRDLLLPLSILLFGSCLISGAIGLLPLPLLDANAFASYWSNCNSLRLAKGFLWGGLIFLWIRRTQIDRHRLAKLFAIGMGLGLAVSRAMAEAHGGTLDLADTAHGEFHLILPAAQAAERMP